MTIALGRRGIDLDPISRIRMCLATVVATGRCRVGKHAIGEQVRLQTVASHRLVVGAPAPPDGRVSDGLDSSLGSDSQSPLSGLQSNVPFLSQNLRSQLVSCLGLGAGYSLFVQLRLTTLTVCQLHSRSTGTHKKTVVRVL